MASKILFHSVTSHSSLVEPFITDKEVQLFAQFLLFKTQSWRLEIILRPDAWILL